MVMGMFKRSVAKKSSPSTQSTKNSDHSINDTSIARAEHPSAAASASATATATTKQQVAPYHKQDPPQPPKASVNGKSAKTSKTITIHSQTHQNHKQPVPTTINGTSSTALWIARSDANAVSANGEKHIQRTSQHTNNSAESYYEEETIHEEDDNDEYDSDFFEYVEEEGVPSASGQTNAVEETRLLPLPERKITIRFDEYDEMQTCLHINDYTKSEINKSWYKREDYDKMVDLARKTASKAVKREKELREELERMLGEGQNAGLGSVEDNDHQKENSVPSSDTKKPPKRKKPIEYRGLEAWTPDGASKVRFLKESAIELVWNEQSRQWENGTFDPKSIREVYLPVSKAAGASALERGIHDEDLVKKLIEQERLRAIKKRNRTVYRKSKAALKKTAKNTASGLVSGVAGTTKIALKTGKVGMKLGKRGVKAGVATATLDSRLMKEALKVKKKRECERKKIITPSRAANEREAEEEQLSHQSTGNPASVGPSLRCDRDDQSNDSIDMRSHAELSAAATSVDYGYEDPDHTDEGKSISHRTHSSVVSRISLGTEFSEVKTEFSEVEDDGTNDGKKKKSMLNLLGGPELKLLGVVPIPGTKKVYKEERREHRAEKRIQRMPRRASWETGVSDGKY